LDEPVAGLDPVVGRQIKDLIRRLRPSMAIVMATHDEQIAAAMGDHVTTLSPLVTRLRPTSPPSRSLGRLLPGRPTAAPPPTALPAAW
jgi:ABC-type Mn2+/Zn2+ transport system ATPase subunit